MHIVKLRSAVEQNKKTKSIKINNQKPLKYRYKCQKIRRRKQKNKHQKLELHDAIKTILFYHKPQKKNINHRIESEKTIRRKQEKNHEHVENSI